MQTPEDLCARPRCGHPRHKHGRFGCTSGFGADALRKKSKCVCPQFVERKEANAPVKFHAKVR